MKVSLVHLDLGIGGAEMLMVNAALALLKKGHDVTIYTTHHDPSHCFAQTCGSGVLAKRVAVVGDWLPNSIFGRAIAICSAIRMCYLALWMMFRFQVDDCAVVRWYGIMLALHTRQANCSHFILCAGGRRSSVRPFLATPAACKIHNQLRNALF